MTPEKKFFAIGNMFPETFFCQGPLQIYIASLYLKSVEIGNITHQFRTQVDEKYLEFVSQVVLET